MIKIKKLFKNICYIITIIAIIFIYKIYEKNIINKQASFDFFIVKIALNNKDKKTVYHKIKNLNENNKLIKNYKLNIEKSNFKKKNLNNKKIKNKIDILK